MIKIGRRIEKQTTVATSDTVIVPYIVFSGTVNTEIYKDVTSNDSWIDIGTNHYDYLYCRNQIIIRTATIGFSGLTNDLERQVAARNFAVGSTDRLSVYTDTELKSFWSDFILKSEKTRLSRWLLAKDYISYVLPLSDSIDMAKTTNELSNEYVKYGIESLSEDGVDGLYDWVEGTGIYTGSGFSTKSYWTQGHQDVIIGFLKNGKT
jgi:hypothetical protein